MNVSDYLKYKAQKYGYSNGSKMSKREFELTLMTENLGSNMQIKYNDRDFGVEDCIFINKLNDKIEVTISGERGTHRTSKFDTIEEAYSYIISELRMMKNVSQKTGGYTYR